MEKYRKKPVVVEAIQLRRDTVGDFCKFVVFPIPCNVEKLTFIINTVEGLTIIKENDWIIKNATGELYPCKSDEFKQTYETV